MDAICEQFLPDYHNSVNVILIAELKFYNHLVTTVRSSLQRLCQAMSGVDILTSELESVAHALYHNTLPAAWRRDFYLTRKSLSAYVAVGLYKRAESFTGQWRI